MRIKDMQSEHPFIPALRFKSISFLYDPILFLSGLGKRFKRKIILFGKPEYAPRMIVDVGSGTGTHLALLRETYPLSQIIGIEPDPLLIERTKLKDIPDIRIIEAYGQALPLQDESVDLCLSTFTLHHMPTEVKKATLREIYRMLKPGCIFTLTDWGIFRIKLFRKLLVFENQEYLEDHALGYIPLYAKEAGFTLIKEKLAKPTGVWMWQFVKK
jgi:ubiquinone/menaquinone biosynthesis C-methylase UbiE